MASILSFFAGSAILRVATSAIHEIEAYILYLISAVCFSGACIVKAIDGLKKDQ
jgi:hypothetical protein